MNVYEFVLGIILITTVGSLFRMRLTQRHGSSAPERDGALKEELKALRDRLATLERITVEKESSLDRQIEELRHR